MSYSHRFFLYAPLALLLMFAAAVMIYWRLVAAPFDASLAAANGREIMPGVRMDYASKSLGGFPFRLDAVLDGFSLQVQTRNGPFVWHAEHFAVHALTYGRNHQIFEAAGTQTLAWTDSEGARHRYAFVPGSMRASAIVSGGRLSQFDLDIAALASRELSVARLQFHVRRQPGHDALQFVLSADNLRRTIAGGTGTDQDISVAGVLAPAAPLAALLGGESGWRAAAELWRQHHGSLTIERIESIKDQIRESGSGALALDAQHRLQGRIALTFQAPEQVTKIGRNPSPAQLQYQWLTLRGHRDPSGWPQLTYLFDDGHIYFDSISPNTIVFDPGTDRKVPYSYGPPSEFGEWMQRTESMRPSDAVVLHPLY
jgi:hypothetical protein